MNYTPEQTEMMIERYTANPCREVVDQLADELEKSAKSIIGKLSREGVYQRQVYKTKAGDSPVTKAEIVANIAEAIGFTTEDLVGLDKTPKLVLKKLEKKLCES